MIKQKAKQEIGLNKVDYLLKPTSNYKGPNKYEKNYKFLQLR